ncbi:class I SAM-dependent methyltransferase [Candidatus Woesearchaeota archaeon]|nr:class I SAM-dependent methyltransferase [Candidatus Woesearchaeota archaeon]
MTSLIYKGADFRAYKNRFNSEEDYFHFEIIKGRKIVQLLKQHTALDGKSILDVGCGYGGIIAALLERNHGNKKHIRGIDINKKLISFCKKRFPNQNFLVADAQNIPLQDSSVDVALLADVIEHVNNPRFCLREIHRVLKNGGIAYINFPPYYGPWGGHLKPPLIPPVPYIHYFPERLVRSYIRRRKKNWTPMMIHLNSSATKGFNLNKMTILRIEKLIKNNRFDIIYKKTELAMPWRLPAIKIVAQILQRFLPPLKEVFSGTCSLLVRKK